MRDSAPHSTGDGMPGGAMNVKTSANIWPMKPVFVQFAIANNDRSRRPSTLLEGAA
jgi:hypothetical protein